MQILHCVSFLPHQKVMMSDKYLRGYLFIVTQITTTFFPSNAEPAQILVHPAEVSVFDNDSSVIFECTTIGFPIPTLTWYHNGRPLTNDSRTVIQDQMVVDGGVVFLTSTLEICGAHAVDNGAYSCIAENRVGADRFDFEVDINMEGVLTIVDNLYMTIYCL